MLPALTGTNYDHLDISDGMSASLTFVDILSNKFTEEEIIKIRQNLEKYCALDTEGMIWIVNKLIELVR